MSAQTAIAFFVDTLLKEYIKEQYQLFNVDIRHSSPRPGRRTVLGNFSFDIVDFKRELDVGVIFRTRQKIVHDFHMFAWRNNLSSIAKKIENFGKRTKDKKVEAKWGIFTGESADSGLAFLHIELNRFEYLNVEFVGPTAELESFSPHFASQS